MKLQQSPVLACILLFLLTISPEFTEAGIPLGGIGRIIGRTDPKLPRLPPIKGESGGIGRIIGRTDPKLPRLPPIKGESAATPAAVKKSKERIKEKFKEEFKEKIKEEFKEKLKEEIKERLEKRLENIQDTIDFWNEYAPGQLSDACRHITKIKGSVKLVKFCSSRRCTESCNNDSYNCGVCYRAHVCLCYKN